MKIINSGYQYRIFKDDTKTFDALPAQTYVVEYNDQAGFYLEKVEDSKISEKVYGIHNEKVDKVLKSFEMFNRNLGVILSGDKGIGKSLFAKLLSAKAIEKGIPIILVNKNYDGIADFLSSISQEVMVLFDEFDKVFAKCNNDDQDPQASMLTLFDGIYTGKKLFVITCNYIYGLNDYIINRTGRFHYHFRFLYPNSEEIETYLKDNVYAKYYDQINDVIAFGNKFKLNYDSLRSIAFEINLGGKFRDFIKDLNIVNNEAAYYEVNLIFKNAPEKIFKASCAIDLFSAGTFVTSLTENPSMYSIYEVKFDLKDAKYDYKTNRFNVVKSTVSIVEDYADNKEYASLMGTDYSLSLSIINTQGALDFNLEDV